MGAETAALAAIGSPRRREILRLAWREERPAGEIHRAMGDLTFGAVSQHLHALLAEGLLEVRTAGRQRLYRARREAFGPVGELLERMWDDALWQLRQRAELMERRRGPRPRRLARRRKGTT